MGSGPSKSIAKSLHGPVGKVVLIGSGETRRPIAGFVMFFCVSLHARPPHFATKLLLSSKNAQVAFVGNG